MPQAPGQTQSPQGARGARPSRAAVPPEFDALPIWKMEPAKLVELVKDPNSTVFQKAIACKKLAFVGGKEAVGPMAALLGHPQLGCYARFGLEPNPDPSVDEVLRAVFGLPDGRSGEGVGLDDVRAGADVFLMDLGDQIRLRDVERVEALVDEHALRVQHRAHRAVADEHALSESVQERFQHLII